MKKVSLSTMLKTTVTVVEYIFESYDPDKTGFYKKVKAFLQYPGCSWGFKKTLAGILGGNKDVGLSIMSTQDIKYLPALKKLLNQYPATITSIKTPSHIGLLDALKLIKEQQNPSEENSLLLRDKLNISEIDISECDKCDFPEECSQDCQTKAIAELCIFLDKPYNNVKKLNISKNPAFEHDCNLNTLFRTLSLGRFCQIEDLVIDGIATVGSDKRFDLTRSIKRGRIMHISPNFITPDTSSIYAYSSENNLLQLCRKNQAARFEYNNPVSRKRPISRAIRSGSRPKRLST